jgi:hypothetical protein
MAFTEKQNVYSTDDFKVNQGCLIKLTYISEKYKISEKTLLNFGFIDSAKNVNFAIVIPAQPTKTELQAANMLQEYFIFCAKRKIINTHSPKARIIKSDKIPAKGKLIVLNNKTSPAGISMSSPKILTVKAEDIVPLVKNMEYVLDKRFTYEFPFEPVMGLYKYQLKHFKMYGKRLPYRKYFETNK